MNELIISLIINGLLGVSMFFMKQSHGVIKEHPAQQRKEIQHIKYT